MSPAEPVSAKNQGIEGDRRGSKGIDSKGIILPVDFSTSISTSKLSYPERVFDLCRGVAGKMIGDEKVWVTARG